MDNKIEIQNALSEFDKAQEKAKDLICKYLDGCNKTFTEEDKAWLTMDEFEEMEVAEIDGKNGVILNRDGFEYDYREFPMFRLINLYDLISEIIEGGKVND